MTYFPLEVFRFGALNLCIFITLIIEKVFFLCKTKIHPDLPLFAHIYTSKKTEDYNISLFGLGEENTILPSFFLFSFSSSPCQLLFQIFAGNISCLTSAWPLWLPYVTHGLHHAQTLIRSSWWQTSSVHHNQIAQTRDIKKNVDTPREVEEAYYMQTSKDKKDGRLPFGNNVSVKTVEQIFMV